MSPMSDVPLIDGQTRLTPARDNTISTANQVSYSAEKEAYTALLKRHLHKIRMEGHKKRKIYLARREEAKRSRAVRRRQLMARRGKRKGQ